jgi:hypothetical protein
MADLKAQWPGNFWIRISGGIDPFQLRLAASTKRDLLAYDF